MPESRNIERQERHAIYPKRDLTRLAATDKANGESSTTVTFVASKLLFLLFERLPVTARTELDPVPRCVRLSTTTMILAPPACAWTQQCMLHPRDPSKPQPCSVSAEAQKDGVRLQLSRWMAAPAADGSNTNSRSVLCLLGASNGHDARVPDRLHLASSPPRAPPSLCAYTAIAPLSPLASPADTPAVVSGSTSFSASVPREGRPACENRVWADFRPPLLPPWSTGCS